jgi:hypothetical protein
MSTATFCKNLLEIIAYYRKGDVVFVVDSVVEDKIEDKKEKTDWQNEGF